MHESTRKLLCRLAFLVSCVVPTLFTVVCCLLVQTPWYAERQKRHLETALRHQFGIIFEIDAIERPAPDSLHLYGVTLRDPENEMLIGRCRIISWGRVDGRIGIRMGQPELNGAALERVWQLAHDRFIADPFLTQEDVNIQVNDLTLGSTLGRRTFQQLAIKVRKKPESIQAALEFALAGELNAEPAQVALERFRNVPEPFTRWHLRSGATPLPCALLADYLPVLQNLGPEAQFSGAMSWEIRSTGVTGNLSGSHFTDVNIGRFTEPLPHKMTGIADFHVRRGEIHDGAVTDFAGTIRCVDGSLGATTIEAAQQTLGIEIDAAVGDLQSGLLRYDEIVLHAEKQDDRFRISGNPIAGEENGWQWVMRFGERPTAWCQAETDVALHQMFGFLIDPATPLHLPKSPILNELLRIFPEGARSREAESPTPSVHISALIEGEQR